MSVTVQQNRSHFEINNYKFVKDPSLRRIIGGNKKLQSTNLDVQFSKLDRGLRIVVFGIVAPYYLVQTWRISSGMSMMVWTFPA